MRRLLLLFSVAILAVANVGAQSFEKGDWTLGAQLSGLDFRHTFAKDISLTNFEITANGGYFISEKFAVEVSLGFGYDKQQEIKGDSSFAFGAGIRYYPVKNLFARIDYLGTVRSGGDGVASWPRISVGYDFFVSDKVFFEPLVYYSKRVSEGTKFNRLGASFGAGVKF